MGKSLQNPLDRFVEQFGIAAKQDGLPRIAGRLMGWFVVHGGPASLSELADTLHVSRASISTNARLLEQLGVLERVAVPGERQDFYRFAENPYARLLESHVERLQTRLDHLTQLMPHVDEAGPDAVSRVQAMREFYDQAISSSESLMTQFDDAAPRIMRAANEDRANLG
ncbi:MAG: MarR family transcriptional regulator [Abyssibacter sp.]|nr:MarR family transcriptional regulator [Abyssibacter sp.]MCK5857742.1 MarR family transcriptional regulator [Abyssibacter sp.]